MPRRNHNPNENVITAATYLTNKGRIYYDYGQHDYLKIYKQKNQSKVVYI